MKDPSDTATIDAIFNELQWAMDSGLGFTESKETTKLTAMISEIINIIFYSIIAITMFLCFFSLCASMASNMYE